MRRDHLLDGHEVARLAAGQETRQERRDLHAREAMDAGVVVAHHEREVERQVRDVREGVRGVDRERRQHREDLLVEQLRELGLRSPRRARPRRGARCRRRRASAAAPWPAGRPDAARVPSTRGRSASSCSVAPSPSGERTSTSASSCAVESGDAHLEEVVEVLARDREELDALEQRMRGVLGQRDHARDELELRELPVQVGSAHRDAARQLRSLGVPIQLVIAISHRATPRDPRTIAAPARKEE